MKTGVMRLVAVLGISALMISSVRSQTLDAAQQPTRCTAAVDATNANQVQTANTACSDANTGTPTCNTFDDGDTFSGVAITGSRCVSVGAGAVTVDGPGTSTDDGCSTDADCAAGMCMVVRYVGGAGTEISGTFCREIANEGEECSETTRCDPRMDDSLRTLTCVFDSTTATTGVCEYVSFAFNTDTSVTLPPRLTVETDDGIYSDDIAVVMAELTVPTAATTVLCGQYLSPVYMLPMRETIGGISVYRQARFVCLPPSLTASGIYIDTESGMVRTGNHDVGIALAYPKDETALPFNNDDQNTVYRDGFMNAVHSGVGMDSMYVTGKGTAAWDALWHSYLYFGPLTVDRTYVNDDSLEHYTDNINTGFYSSAIQYGAFVYVDVLRPSEDKEEWEAVSTNDAGTHIMSRIQLIDGPTTPIFAPDEDVVPDTIVNVPFSRVKGIHADPKSKTPFSKRVPVSSILDPEHTDKNKLDFDLDGSFTPFDIRLSLEADTGDGIIFTEHLLDHTNNDRLSYYDKNDAYTCYIAATGVGAKGTKNAGVVTHSLTPCVFSKRYEKRDGFHEIKSTTVKDHRYWPVFVKNENPADTIQFCGHSDCNNNKNTVFVNEDGTVKVWVNTLVESAFYPPQDKVMHGADFAVVILATLAIILETVHGITMVHNVPRNS